MVRAVILIYFEVCGAFHFYGAVGVDCHQRHPFQNLVESLGFRILIGLHVVAYAVDFAHHNGALCHNLHLSEDVRRRHGGKRPHVGCRLLRRHLKRALDRLFASATDFQVVDSSFRQRQGEFAVYVGHSHRGRFHRIGGGECAEGGKRLTLAYRVDNNAAYTETCGLRDYANN